jgi:hypothetical protein
MPCTTRFDPTPKQLTSIAKALDAVLNVELRIVEREAALLSI